jgi:hypothetical protein
VREKEKAFSTIPYHKTMMMETADMETSARLSQDRQEEEEEEEAPATTNNGPIDDIKYHSPLWSRLQTRMLIKFSKLRPGTVVILTVLLFFLLIWDFDPDNSMETAYDTSAHMVRFTAEDAIPEQQIILMSAQLTTSTISA